MKYPILFVLMITTTTWSLPTADQLNIRFVVFFFFRGSIFIFNFLEKFLFLFPNRRQQPQLVSSNLDFDYESIQPLAMITAPPSGIVEVTTTNTIVDDDFLIHSSTNNRIPNMSTPSTVPTTTEETLTSTQSIKVTGYTELNKDSVGNEVSTEHTDNTSDVQNGDDAKVPSNSENSIEQSQSIEPNSNHEINSETLPSNVSMAVEPTQIMGIALSDKPETTKDVTTSSNLLESASEISSTLNSITESVHQLVMTTEGLVLPSSQSSVSSIDEIAETTTPRVPHSECINGQGKLCGESPETQNPAGETTENISAIVTTENELLEKIVDPTSTIATEILLNNPAESVTKSEMTEISIVTDSTNIWTESTIPTDTIAHAEIETTTINPNDKIITTTSDPETTTYDPNSGFTIHSSFLLCKHSIFLVIMILLKQNCIDHLI